MLKILLFTSFVTFWASLSLAFDIQNAEYGGLCMMGLAEGKIIKTDCDITWTAQNGKTYCFQSEDAKKTFLQHPNKNLEMAKEFYAVNNIQKTASLMGLFSTSDVEHFVTQYIKNKSLKNGGFFPLRDPILGKDLKLVFDGIDFTRKLHGYGYFPSIKFHLKDNPDKKYLIDFWIRPENQKLTIMEERIYKAPRRYEGKWTLWMRDPRPWWWIPASEHPGQSEEKRAWEVISAIETKILKEKQKNGGQYMLTDKKTGEIIPLEFVGVHQPVRRLKKDGRYFACTDFRKHGTQNQYFDIDFWLDEENGNIRVGDVRIHKVPTMKDGGFIQIERYNFDNLDAEIIP